MNIVKLSKIIEKLGLSKTTIYDKLNKKSTRYDSTFPKPIQFGTSKNSSIRFIDEEINAWIQEQIDKRNVES